MMLDDGKSVTYQKDYVLRGLQIPAGKHNIEFKFEPQNKNRGMITLISSILIVLVLVVEFILKGRDLRLLISDFFYIIVLLKFLHLEQKKILIITYYCTRWTGCTALVEICQILTEFGVQPIVYIPESYVSYCGSKFSSGRF
jgi:hypothetical protein